MERDADGLRQSPNFVGQTVRYREVVHYVAPAYQDVRYPDGQISNFEFDSYADALPAWRYLDLTDHALYAARVVGETLRTDMVEEAEFLQNLYRLRERLVAVIQAGDNALDRIIRSVGQNKRITGALKAEYPILEDVEIAERVLQAVIGA